METTFFLKKEYIKSKEFYNQIFLIKNLQDNFYYEANSRLALIKMRNSKLFIIFITYCLLSGCSFDSKTGIWDGRKGEKKRISDLEDKQNSLLDSEKIYTSKDIFYDEISIKTIRIILNKPKNNINWKTSNLKSNKIIKEMHLFIWN